MMKFKMTFAVSVAFAGLAACGGTNEPTVPLTPQETELIARTAEFEDLLDDTDGIAASGASVMSAATSNVSFEGMAVLIVDPTVVNDVLRAAEASLLGDVSFDFNLVTGQASGSATNFYGSDGLSGTANIDEYSGSLTLDNGTIGVGAHNAITLDYGGTLSGNDQVIVADGTASGLVLGNPNVRAVEMSENGTVTFDGVSTDGYFYIVAEPE